VKVSLYLASLEKMRRPPTPRPVATLAPVAPAPPHATMAPTPSAMPSRAARRLTFHGSGGTLFGIHIVNILRTLVTLGVYRFWGKVRVRRYMLSQTAFEGDRFAYHGTGKELLLGFLKAVLVFGLPVTALNLAGQLSGDELLANTAQVLTWAAVVVFIPVAMVGARRYRLSRTSWRGIRFSFHGRMWDFIKLFVGGSLLTSLTLGLYYPFFKTKQQAFMVSRSYFGQRPFRFDGRGRDLFRPYLLAVLLTLPTLGLCWFWFQARTSRYFWEQTFFEAARFRSTVTGRPLLNLTIGNLLLLLVTLGFAWPWALVRNARFAFAYLTLEGALDLAGIVQEPQTASATGDALSGFLGADVDLG
jgi:uncharacterized membrane protein YjgN (DUF898 family)